MPEAQDLLDRVASRMDRRRVRSRARARARRDAGPSVPILARPVPGTFYEIQAGKGGLLTTAGRAYGVGPGADRLRLAQRIANHPRNRALLVPPGNAFDRQNFPLGIVSFSPRFTCGVPQRVARSSEKRCFGIVWIPPRAGGDAFPLLPRILLAPTASKGVGSTAKELISKLGTGPFCARRSLDLTVGDDNRSKVSGEAQTRLPFRWVCKLLTIHAPDDRGRRAVGQASGVLLSPTRLLTCAHVVDTESGTPDAMIVIPGFSKSGLAAVSAFDEVSAPFGAWLVPRFRPKGAASFLIAPEFRSHGDYAADYALVDLARARRLTEWGKIPDGWLGVSTVLATSAAQAANPAGAAVPLDPYDDNAPVRRFLRLVGSTGLKAAGYPVDHLCEMMLAVDQVRPDGFFPDTARHALIENRLDTTFGNSGGPVWVERVVRRREGGRLVPRRQVLLAGLNQSALHPAQERIDFAASSRGGRVVKKARPTGTDLSNHVSSAFVVLTPFVLGRVLNPGRLLPA